MGNICPWFQKESKPDGQSTTETLVPTPKGAIPIQGSTADSDLRSVYANATTATTKVDEGLSLSTSSHSQLDLNTGLLQGSSMSLQSLPSTPTNRLLISNIESDRTGQKKEPPSIKKIQKLLEKTDNEDLKTINDPKFTTFHKVDDHLFLTGLWGINKENLEKHAIKLVINATKVWPCYIPYDYVRINVSGLIACSMF